MKHRTKAITLTMLAGTAIALGGCQDDDKPKLIKDEAECVKEYGDVEGCHTAAQQAANDHENMAPRFRNRKDCEDQFGAASCQQVDHGGSGWFMPAMIGFMMGRLTDGSNSYRVQPACRNGDNIYTNGCGPVSAGGRVFYYPGIYNYAGRYSGGAYQPAEEYVGSWTSGKVAASRAAASPSAVARGGFGGSAVGEGVGE